MKNNQSIRQLLRKVRKVDIKFILNIYILVFLSLSFVYSASLKKHGIFFKKEIVWTLLGTIVFIIFSLIDYKKYAKYSKVIYTLNIGLLLSVYVIGKKILGAKRWISLGFMSIQPSEFAKIFLVLTFSELLANKYSKGVRGWKNIIVCGFHILIPFLLILKEPDLGTSLVLIFIFFLLIFLNDVDLYPLFSLVGAGIIFIPIAYFFLLKDYQRGRIDTFLDPTKDLHGSGWNVVQSMIATGSGGLFGKGFLHGTQNKLKFLPESHTDFIFSVLSEELGFLGSSILIILYLTLIIYIINVGRKTKDRYGKFVAFGIAGIFFFHVFVNIGMAIGIMPVTGLPLLLMSYGGSSFMFSFMMLGIVQSIKNYSN
ncbi:rod shape-determining protein RodA [Haliovirga abyssi]|uniref:Peptidoglycan glycosyltransferase RodA n=1 Tax=Haliovirga abyssi TaxID=2996794 RepID=A0AAU9DZ44_9FUSO|nr:rod shape-determining protein RodA [Haliovirga abyssi]BDU50765.1 rod shape-determining protein RodA [Haliovirga abyssi]